MAHAFMSRIIKNIKGSAGPALPFVVENSKFYCNHELLKIELMNVVVIPYVEHVFLAIERGLKSSKRAQHRS